MENLNVGNWVQISSDDSNNGLKGQITNNAGNPIAGPFSVRLSTGVTIDVSRINLISAPFETFDKKLFDLVSTYNRSIVGDIYLLLRAKSTGNLYFQRYNPRTYTVDGPYFVGVTKNDEAHPDEGTLENFNLNNATFTFEDVERNPNLDNGSVVIIGQSNTKDRDTYRYVCTRIGGPWKRQKVFREIN